MRLITMRNPRLKVQLGRTTAKNASPEAGVGSAAQTTARLTPLTFGAQARRITRSIMWVFVVRLMFQTTSEKLIRME